MKAATTGKTKTAAADDDGGAAGRHIDARIAELADWRGATLATVRGIIRAADKAIIEEWKWDVPVWSAGGIICTGEVYKAAVKLTFARGAALPDPKGLFNASLAGNTRRAVDIREGETINAAALTALVRAAVKLNAGKAAAKKAAAKSK